MSPVRTRSKLPVTAILAVLALLALPCSAAELPAATEQDYLALITQLRDAGGPSSRALIEPMTSLALLYQEQGNFQDAAELLARARGIMRAADGFDTLPEAAMLARQVRLEEARGDLRTAWELEQSLLTLLHMHPGALATVPLYREVLRKRQELLDRYRAGERPSQIELGCYYDSAALMRTLLDDATYAGKVVDCTAGDRSTAQASLLAEIRQYQLHMLDALFQNGLYASDELQALLTNVLSSTDQLRRTLPHFVVFAGDSYTDELLTKLLSYQARDSAERVRRAQLLIVVADINVLRAQRTHSFSNYESVLEQYRQAYAMLQREGVDQAALDEIFAPAVPVTLPAYEASPLSSEPQSPADGYVDVEFELTLRGLSREVDASAMSEGVKRNARRELLERIRRGAFRPRLVDGDFPAVSAVSVRYYVDTELPTAGAAN